MSTIDLAGAPYAPGSTTVFPDLAGQGFTPPPPTGAPEIIVTIGQRTAGGYGGGTTTEKIFSGDQLMEVVWHSYRFGGNGHFTCRLADDFTSAETATNNEWEITVKVKLSTDADYSVWYRGFVKSFYRERRGQKIYTIVNGLGYAAQLGRLAFDATYTNRTTSAIAQYVLDSVAAAADITYTTTDVVGSYVVERFNYAGTALRALKALAEVQNSTEWGVDETRKAFFKAVDATNVNHRLFEQKDVVDILQAGAQNKRVNRLEIEGETDHRTRTAQSSNSPTYPDQRSTRFAQATAFREANDLTRWGTGALGSTDTVQEWLRIKVVQVAERLDIGTTAAPRPIGLFRIQFQDGTTKDYQLGKVVYRLGGVKTDPGGRNQNAQQLEAEVYLGQFGKDLSEEIDEMQGELHDLRMKLRKMSAAPRAGAYLVASGHDDLPSAYTFGNSVSMRGVLADRPASAITGALYAASDNGLLYRYSGDPTAAWNTVASSGGYVGGLTGGTAGSVFFAGALGVLAEDNTNFFWDDTNNAVRIGARVVTISSGYGLLVESKQFPLSAFYTTAGTQLSGLRLEHTDNTNSASHCYATVHTGGASGGDPVLQWGILSTRFFAVGIDNSNGDLLTLGTATSQVSLGTGTLLTVSAAAAFTFGVVSATTATLSLAHASSALLTSFTAGNATAAVTYTLPTAGPAANGYVLSSTTAGVMSWVAASAGTVLGSGTATRIAFWSAADTLSSSASLYWDDGNARLGVGTNAPSYGIHLRKATTTEIISDCTGTGALAAVDVINDSSVAGVFAVFGSAYAGTTAGLANANLVKFEAQGASAFLLNTNNNIAMAFGTNNVERMRLTATGLGIGVTPSYVLHVKTTAATDMLCETSSASFYASFNLKGDAAKYGVITMFSSAQGGTTAGVSNNDLFRIEAQSASGLLLNTNSAVPLILCTNSTERIRILSTGNVGIGTAGPDAKLDVLATTEQLRLTYTDGSAYASHTISSNGDYSITPVGGAGLQFLALTKSHSGQTLSLQCLNTSNTASSHAEAVISVGGSSAGDAVYRMNVSGVLNWCMAVDNSDGDSLCFAKASLPGTNYLRIDTSGNVSIGSAALATNATDGFLYIPTMAGAPSGTPTAHTGRAALVLDTTNNRLYVYDPVDAGWLYAALT